MGKLFPRLSGGPFPKLEGGKHKVGSDAEVRISIKGEKDQSGSGSEEGHFFRAQTHVC